MRPKDYSVAEVYNSTQIGFRFDFYSSKKTEFILEDLSKSWGKAVVITDDPKARPTWSSAILLKEFAGKKPRYQLKIAPQDYMSIGQGLGATLKWISENASLDYSTLLSVDLSFKHRELQTLMNIGDMNVGKMILKVDENLIYEKFPEMKASPFSLSVKKIVPFDGFINISNPVGALNNSFQLPIAEYYAIDFTEQPMGFIKFNYIGGSDYAAKPHDINETIKYYIISTYQVLNTSDYTIDMKSELDKLTEEYSRMRRSYYEPQFFLDAYPGIKVSVDLKKNEQVIKTYWDKLRNPLLKLVLESGLKKGYFNWDSDAGRFEIKDSNLDGTRISGFHLVNCTGKALVENCHIWKSELKNSRIKNSTLVQGNNINTSLIEECRADMGNTINRSYIINNGEIINCKVNESVVKNAGIGKSAKLDENCTLIQDFKKEAPKQETGVNIKEVRDYRWLKDMRSSEDQGFQNEYKTKYD